MQQVLQVLQQQRLKQLLFLLLQLLVPTSLSRLKLVPMIRFTQSTPLVLELSTSQLWQQMDQMVVCPHNQLHQHSSMLELRLVLLRSHLKVASQSPFTQVLRELLH